MRYDEFIARVVEQGGPADRTHARAVLGTLASFVSTGELDDVRAQLPAGYAPLFT